MLTVCTICLFTVVKGDYLQGYLPIWLLTINAFTKQFLQSQYLASGPTFIDEPQSANAIQCEVDQFKVCPPPVIYDYNQITNVRPIGLTLSCVVFATGIFFACWTWVYQKQPALAVSQVSTIVFPRFRHWQNTKTYFQRFPLLLTTVASVLGHARIRSNHHGCNYYSAKY